MERVRGVRDSNGGEGGGGEVPGDWLAISVRILTSLVRFVLILVLLSLPTVSELGGLNIGSRPAKRQKDGGVETLRAIPWIFAWTQTRLHLPVWLGIGEAIDKAIEGGE